uniref:Uncharacterized protein n=1 Tax=Cacopsylla melanoneura TaxID=428564 RepID=A0A8D8ZW04_9HEMI
MNNLFSICYLFIITLISKLLLYYSLFSVGQKGRGLNPCPEQTLFNCSILYLCLVSLGYVVFLLSVKFNKEMVQYISTRPLSLEYGTTLYIIFTELDCHFFDRK